MKLFHLSDLHIGKRVHEFSMIEDQKYMLTQILQAVMREKPDGVLISGDVYDRTIPTAEAVQVLDAFLTAFRAGSSGFYHQLAIMTRRSGWHLGRI